GFGCAASRRVSSIRRDSSCIVPHVHGTNGALSIPRAPLAWAAAPSLNANRRSPTISPTGRRQCATAAPCAHNRRRSMRRAVIAAVVSSALDCSTFVQEHGLGRRYRIEQNEPPATELVVAWWRLGTNGWFGHMGWSHNYPRSERNLNEFLGQ